jgi:hypothetical protein
VTRNQGDQIGGIFTQWMIVYFRQFSENYGNSPHFWATHELFSTVIIIFTKCIGLHFGRFFLQTHLVTLQGTNFSVLAAGLPDF